MTISTAELAKKLRMDTDLSKLAETRGLYLENQIISSTQINQRSALFNGKTHDTSGSVFYRCVLAADYDNPNSLTIDCLFLTELTYKSVCELGRFVSNDVDLSGADLSNADLRSTNLQGANLRCVGVNASAVSAYNPRTKGVTENMKSALRMSIIS